MRRFCFKVCHSALCSYARLGFAAVDPEIVYLAGGYGAAVSGEKSVLAAATWEAYRRVQVNWGPASLVLACEECEGRQNENAFWA